MRYFKFLSDLPRKNQSCVVCFALAMFSGILLFQANLTASTRSSDYYCSFEVIGYYPDYWQTPLPDIQYDKLTQVVFFSVYPNSDGSLNTSQVDSTRQKNLVESAHDHGVSVTVCIGGWGLSDNFSSTTSSLTKRSAFINNLTQYCLAHDFDGIVLDWEPVTATQDKANYTLLIQELKTSLTVHNLSLGVAVAAAGSEFNPAAINSIDQLHIMAYDMTNDNHSSYQDAIGAVAHWQEFGFDKSKIILGLPFYGRKANWWYAESYEPYDKIIAEYLPSPDVDEVNGIYFNGINTIRQKTRFMLENKYSGVMFWELTEDTYDKTSLLTAVSNEILFSREPDFNCDNVIDLLDLKHLAFNWLNTNCNSANLWCQASDLDQSDSVSLSDLTLFIQSWMSD